MKRQRIIVNDYDEIEDVVFTLNSKAFTPEQYTEIEELFKNYLGYKFNGIYELMRCIEFCQLILDGKLDDAYQLSFTIIDMVSYNYNNNNSNEVINIYHNVKTKDNN